MEDKRTLIAFLIIGLIVLLMPYYLEWLGLSAPPPQQPPPEAQEIRETPPTSPLSAPLPETVEPLVRSREIRAPGDSIFTPRAITVQTPLQRLVFSTAGGVLTSARLLEYTKAHSRVDPGGPAKVELVPPGGRGLVLLLKQREELLDLSAMEFVPDREEIQLQPGQEAVLRLAASLRGGRSVEKVLRFHGDRHGIDVEILCEGFGEDTEVLLGWEGGIAPTERYIDSDLAEMRAIAFMNEELTELRLQDENEQQWEDKGLLKLAGVRNKYFLTALAPAEEGHYRVALKGRAENRGPVPRYSYQIGVRIGDSGRWKSLFYLGPLDYEELIGYQKDLERAMDLGWPVVREISALLMGIFVAAYTYVPNYGWVIVLFAAAIKLLVYPLTKKSFDSASKMQQLQPKLVALREKHKNDPQRLSRETMKLYKDEGINPLGGCLPILLQMPIFFALYNVFSNTIELRQAPFMLWIDDLSLPDEILIAGFGDPRAAPVHGGFHVHPAEDDHEGPQTGGTGLPDAGHDDLHLLESLLGIGALLDGFQPAFHRPAVADRLAQSQAPPRAGAPQKWRVIRGNP